MRISLWLLALFAAAVAAALFAGQNPGSVTVFWPPYRIDLSLNLVLVLALASFLTLHLALRALSALFAIPREARMWRQRQRERSMQLSLLDAYSQLVAGRFVRAKKSAELVLEQVRNLASSDDKLSYADQLLTTSHLLAAEAAHALQDRGARETHYRAALEHAARGVSPEAGEGARMRAARWALDDRDSVGALQLLDDLGQGAGRRVLALRMRLKAARMAGRTVMAMETARLLAKHHALSQVAAQGVLRGLSTELIATAYDPAQLIQVWARLEPAEQAMPDVALAAAQRLLELQGDAALSRQWLLPVWQQMLEQPSGLAQSQRVDVVRVLELGFAGGTETLEGEWLTRIESAQLSHPGDPVLQYLAGVTCMRLQLWGKARQLLQQSLVRLQDGGLRRDAWRQLAALAAEQGDTEAATAAWRSAAQA
ncbi:MAG: heme biosynthesis protein HemY [Rhodoferax sp.]|jgi:HemY protein|nr:heme biosynthesis protein HemY [Rhodoferax sp.]